MSAVEQVLLTVIILFAELAVVSIYQLEGE